MQETPLPLLACKCCGTALGEDHQGDPEFCLNCQPSLPLADSVSSESQQPPTRHAADLGMAVHPATELFPMMDEAALAELAADIGEHGLLEAITLCGDALLDGRNRLRACRLAGVEPRFAQWAGTGSPTTWVIAKNLHRRHLTPSQRAAVAVEMLPLLEAEAKARQGARTDLGADINQRIDESRGQALDHAAEATGANRQYVADAKRLKAEAPDLYADVRTGARNIPQATQEAKARQARARYPELQQPGIPPRETLTIAASLDALPDPERAAARDGLRAGAPGVMETLAGLPPMPAADGRPLDDPAGRKWNKTLHDLHVAITSIRDHGGIRLLADKWSAQNRQAYADELGRLVETLNRYREELEEAIRETAVA